MVEAVSKTGVWKDRDHVLLVGGYTCAWLWMQLVFWSSTFSENFLHISDAANPFQVSLLANVATYCVLIFVCRKLHSLGAWSRLPLIAALLMSVGCMLYVVDGFVSRGHFAIMEIGSLATGVGSAVLLVLWGEQWSCASTRKMLTGLITSAAACGLLGSVLTLTPRIVGQVGSVCLPLLSCYCYMVLARSNKLRVTGEGSEHITTRFPVRMVVITAIFGVFFGMMRGLHSGESLAGFSPNAQLNSFATMITLVIAAGIVFVTAIVLKLDFRRLTVQVTVILVGAGFVLLAIPELQFLALSVNNLGIHHFYIILWATLAYHGQRHENHAGWLVACGMFFLQAGQVSGVVTGSLVAATWPGGDALHVVVDCVLFVLLVVAIGFFESGVFKTGYNLVRPGLINDYETSDAQQRDFDQRCSIIAQAYGLSARETEVFMLLARGYDRPRICDALTIGDETVKTHIKHIYQKAQIHTRDELSELVERESRRIVMDNYGL